MISAPGEKQRTSKRYCNTAGRRTHIHSSAITTACCRDMPAKVIAILVWPPAYNISCVSRTNLVLLNVVARAFGGHALRTGPGLVRNVLNNGGSSLAMYISRGGGQSECCHRICAYVDVDDVHFTTRALNRYSHAMVDQSNPCSMLSRCPQVQKRDRPSSCPPPLLHEVFRNARGGRLTLSVNYSDSIHTTQEELAVRTMIKRTAGRSVSAPDRGHGPALTALQAIRGTRH